MDPNDRRVNVTPSTRSNRIRQLYEDTSLGYMAGKRPALNEDDYYDDFYDNSLDDPEDDDDRD